MKNPTIAALSIRPFAFLWIAEVFSQLAINMMNFILIIVAYNLTSSNAAVSGIVLAFTIPAILFGILAGVYVDRWNKKTVLFVTNILRAGLLLSLIFFHTNLVLLYSITFVTYLVTQFFIPAETPMIPLVVPRRLLLSANALFGIGIFGSVLLAYALSGPLLLFFGEHDIFLLLGLFFIIAAFFASLIQYKKGATEEDTQLTSASQSSHFFEEIKVAFSIIKKTEQIYNSLFLLAITQTLILIIAVLGPGYAEQILRIPVNRFPLLFATPAAFGTLVGALVISNFFQKASKQKSVTIGIFMCAVSIALLPFAVEIVGRGGVVVFMVCVSFLLGFSNALVFVPANTILQEVTTDAFRGKMYGTLNTLVGLFSLFPIILVGELADTIGVSPVLLFVSGVVFFIGLYKVIMTKKYI